MRPIPQLDHEVDLERVRSAPLHFMVDGLRHGDIFGYEAGGWRCAVINDPALVREVLSDSARFVKHGTPEMMMLQPMLGAGLMTSEGESWRVQRRSAQPSFTREALEGYRSTIASAANRASERFCAAAAASDVIDLEKEANRLTFEVVAETLFGTPIFERSVAFGEAVATLNAFMARFDPTDGERIRDYVAALGSLREIAGGIIDKRNTATDVREDLLTAMLEQDEAGTLNDRVFTFLMAGHETTAKALTWTLWFLEGHPLVSRRVDEELRTVLGTRDPMSADVHQLPYLWQVVQESLRLRPPVWLMSRVAASQENLGSYRVDAGTLLLVSPYSLHRNPRYWSDPETFDPDRFIAGREIVPWSYIPFSGGQRKCIGANFAALELMIVLAIVLRKVRFAFAASAVPVEEALITLRPRDGMPMRPILAA